jgi:antitoxin HigA-1
LLALIIMAGMQVDQMDVAISLPYLDFTGIAGQSMSNSSITTERCIMGRSATHPGEHLAQQLKELGMSAAELARNLKVPTNRVTGILNGRRAVTGDTALRLGHFFGMSAEFWMNLQKLYELCLAENKSGTMIKDLPTLAKLMKKQDGNMHTESS